jgi:hypothetical protein
MAMAQAAASFPDPNQKSSMGEIEKRNILALEQANKDLTAKMFSQQIRIDSLVATLSGLIIRLNDLEAALLLIRAQATGRGPTHGV